MLPYAGNNKKLCRGEILKYYQIWRICGKSPNFYPPNVLVAKIHKILPPEYWHFLLIINMAAMLK